MSKKYTSESNFDVFFMIAMLVSGILIMIGSYHRGYKAKEQEYKDEIIRNHIEHHCKQDSCSLVKSLQ